MRSSTCSALPETETVPSRSADPTQRSSRSRHAAHLQPRRAPRCPPLRLHLLHCFCLTCVTCRRSDGRRSRPPRCPTPSSLITAAAVLAIIRMRQIERILASTVPSTASTSTSPAPLHAALLRSISQLQAEWASLEAPPSLPPLSWLFRSAAATVTDSALAVPLSVTATGGVSNRRHHSHWSACLLICALVRLTFLDSVLCPCRCLYLGRLERRDRHQPTVGADVSHSFL